MKKQQKVRKPKKPKEPNRSPHRAPAPQASPDEGRSAQEREAETARGTAALESQWEELPDSDEETKVVLLPVNPYLVHVYWGIATNDREELERAFRRPGPRAQPVLRFYDITQVNFDGTNTPGSFEVEIDLRARNWYVHLESPAKSYCIDLGLRTAGGGFHRLARSNVAQTPRASPSDNVEESYLLVEGDYPRAEAVVPPDESTDVLMTPPETPEDGERHSSRENRPEPTAPVRYHRVEVPFSPGQVTEVFKAPPETLYAGEQKGGEVNGPEAKELRIFRTAAPGEIERKLAELYGRIARERSSLVLKASNGVKLQTSGDERADLTEVSEKSFRAGISSGGKSS